MYRRAALALAALALVAAPAAAQEGRAGLESSIQRHAAENGVPPALVHRIIVRESRYNPRAVGRGGAMGLMQIKTATARGMGYTGGPAGLLDAETNLRYAVKYLAGAYRVAGGNHDQAVRYYASGYYYAAKAKGMAGPRAERRRYRHARRAETQRPLSLWPFNP